MGIILSAMAAAGDAGMQSVNQNIDQQNKTDLETQRSQLETQKAQAIIDYQKQATLDMDNQKRQGMMDRLSAAKDGIVKEQLAQKYAPSDAAVQSASDGDTGSQMTPDQLAVIAQSKSMDTGQMTKDPHTFIRAAMASGDIDPKEVASLAMQEDALRRQEVAQKAQFDHADASQASAIAAAAAAAARAQSHSDALQSQAQSFQAGENQKTRDANKERVMPPAGVTDAEKDLYLRPYIASGGVPSRNIPKWAQNSLATWAAQKGITPDDLSKGTAQAKFDQAAANTSGHRAGAMASVEATMPGLVANAQDLSHKLGQGNFVPLNKLMQMTDEAISDPALAAFKVAHMAVVSEYQQVISRGGTNVTALNEAMHVLSGARGVEAYDAAMNMVKKEVAINVAGTAAVREGLGGAHGGAKPVPAMPGPGNPASFNAPAGVSLNYDPKTGTFH